MTIQEFEAMLRDSGLDDATVSTLVKNEKLSAKATSLRQGTEYSTLEAKAVALEASYAKAKSYEDWYGKNAAAIEALKVQTARYQEKYGNLDDAAPANRQQVNLDQDAIKKLVTESIAESFQKNYAPQVVATMTGIGGVVEKHMRRGRKEDIDWKKLDEMAAKTNGDISAAYDLYDEPNMKADGEAAFKARVDKEVKERLAASGVNQFPAGADASPSSRSPLSSSDGDKPKAYDRSKLLETFSSGTYTGFGKTQ